MAKGEKTNSVEAKEGPRRWTACTIARAGELAQARVLATSFREFHPETAFAILVLDLPGEQVALPGVTVLYLRDLGLEKGDEWRLPMLYEADQLRDFVQPALLQSLLDNGNDLVAYFEVSTQIFGTISDVFELVRNTPGILASERMQNDAGDSGRSFVALTSGAQSALSTWSRLLRERTRATPAVATSMDFDSVFDSVPHQVVSPPGFAVSYARLDPKALALSDKGYEIAERPVRTFTFRGYDPDKPHLLSRFLGLEPRILLSEYPVVASLCDDYREQLLRSGYETGGATKSGFEVLPSGLRIDGRMSRIYREAIDDWRFRGKEEPPSPFDSGGEDAFLRWLNQLIDREKKSVTRYMLGVHDDRDDVESAFPDPLGADASRFRDWYLVFGQKELALPAVLVPSRAAAEVAQSDQGAIPVNIAGYFRAELGLGTAARSLLAALEAAEIPCETISFDGTANRLSHPFTDRRSAPKQADINIVCVNPDQLSAFVEHTDPDLWHGRYTIGVWFWEAEDFPASFHSAFNYVDEVWVASEFMRETFMKVSPKPVFKYRLPVLTPSLDQSIDRAYFGLPNQFTFLFSFDFLSVLDRKNPVGLIQAFAKAFAPSEGPVLVIKTINGDKRTLEMEKLKYAIRGRPDIILRDGYFSAVENASFTALADCYVSLHRSEGFGLTIAEAMALRKPTIATSYSGNLEFMTEENSYLCPSRRSEVGPGREPYPADSHWSEPDLDVAVDLLRHVYLNQEEAGTKGVRAAADIASLHSSKAAAALIYDRLEKIRQRRRAGSPQPSIAYLQDRVESLEAQKLRLRSDPS